MVRAVLVLLFLVPFAGCTGTDTQASAVEAAIQAADGLVPDDWQNVVVTSVLWKIQGDTFSEVRVRFEGHGPDGPAAMVVSRIGDRYDVASVNPTLGLVRMPHPPTELKPADILARAVALPEAVDFDKTPAPREGFVGYLAPGIDLGDTPDDPQDDARDWSWHVSVLRTSEDRDFTMGTYLNTWFTPSGDLEDDSTYASVVRITEIDVGTPSAAQFTVPFDVAIDGSQLYLIFKFIRPLPYGALPYDIVLHGPDGDHTAEDSMTFIVDKAQAGDWEVQVDSTIFTAGETYNAYIQEVLTHGDASRIRSSPPPEG